MPPKGNIPFGVARLTFGRTKRLTHATQFAAIYNARMQKAKGPLLVFSKPNDLKHARLGLAVSRRVGNAVKRNRIKRLLREAFRQMQHEIPVRAAGSYDLVISVREHDELDLEAYRRHLADAIDSLHRDWTKREARAADETKGDE